MPVTPFHMGPGLLIKALLRGGFSLMVFGWAQIIMDLQPLFAMITGQGKLHGFSHTFVGATLLGLVAALSGKYLSEWGLKRLALYEEHRYLSIQWWVVFLSAFIGSYSHVFLDAIMHSDMAPFFPFSVTNPWLGLFSFYGVHKFCVYTGLVGAGLYFLVQYILKFRNRW